jgi:hypothetical protein
MKMEGRIDRPVVACDHCGAEIDARRPGHILWHHEPDGSPKGDIYFTHQECSIAFIDRSDDPNWCSKDLDCLPVYLLQSLGTTWDEVRKKVTWLDSLPD